PKAVAVKSEQVELSYGQLEERTNQLGRYLQELGVGSRGRGGVCMERSVEMVVGMIGVLKAGGAYVPLDPRYPKERVGAMLKDAGLAVMRTQQRLVERLPEHAARLVCLDQPDEALEAQSSEALEAQVKADDLAYVIYTSGSTGRPKGAMNTHRGIINR